MFDELNSNFAREEISKAILQLKNGKSAGPDKLIKGFFFFFFFFFLYIYMFCAK